MWINLPLIAPFPRNAAVQFHNHSSKNLTSRLPSGREVWLARLVITNQVK